MYGFFEHGFSWRHFFTQVPWWNHLLVAFWAAVVLLLWRAANSEN